MTVENVTPYIEISAGGLIYNFSFPFIDNSDIIVYALISDGRKILLEEGTDYSLVNNNPGGTVTLVTLGIVTLPAYVTHILISRLVANTQEVNLPDDGRIQTSVLELMADKATLVSQDETYRALQAESDLGTQITDETSARLEADIDLSNDTIHIPNEGLTDTRLPTPVAGLPIGWNNSANGFKSITATDLAALIANVSPVSMTLKLATGINYLNPLPNDTRRASDWLAAYANITAIYQFIRGTWEVYVRDAGTNFTMAYTPTDASNMFMIACSSSQTVSYPPVAVTPLVNRGLTLLDLILTGTSEYADNAAALAAGRPIGTVYRTGDALKIVH